MTLSDPYAGFQGHCISLQYPDNAKASKGIYNYKSNNSKTVHFRNNVTKEH